MVAVRPQWSGQPWRAVDQSVVRGDGLWRACVPDGISPEKERAQQPQGFWWELPDPDGAILGNGDTTL